MNERGNSRVFITALVLCLYWGGLAVMPFNSSLSFEMEISKIEVEDYDSSEDFEPENDFLTSASDAALSKLTVSKSRRANMEFRSDSLSPISPPPKSA